jgi:hypothetical protein
MNHSQRLLSPTALLVHTDVRLNAPRGSRSSVALIAMALIGADVAQAQEGPRECQEYCVRGNRG